MSHRWSCPDDWTARREGERALERGDGYWRNPYEDRWRDGSGCEDAERAWARGYRDAERQEEERVEEARVERHRAEVQRQAEEQWAYESQQEQEYREWADAKYAAMEAAHFDELFEDHLIETIDIPRWEDDGGALFDMEPARRPG